MNWKWNYIISILFIGADADGGAFENLATLTYFNEKQLASGNFSQMAPGLIDVISEQINIFSRIIGRLIFVLAD